MSDEAYERYLTLNASVQIDILETENRAANNRMAKDRAEHKAAMDRVYKDQDYGGMK